MTVDRSLSPGSAARWGPLWGSRADDWTLTEEQELPTFEEAIRRVGIGRGQAVLDVGCGAGVFLRAAADRGARVFGLDAAESLLAIAARRVPDADLRLGDMERMPYDDDCFDVVTGFNSFFFADDLEAALREARRVARPGAPVVIQVWGRPERCALSALRPAAAPFVAQPGPSSARAEPPLWKPGVLERVAAGAGLEPASAFDQRWAFHYPDDQTLARAMMAAGGLAERAGPEQVPALRAAILEALAPHRTRDGAYRLENEWHYLVATA